MMEPPPAGEAASENGEAASEAVGGEGEAVAASEAEPTAEVAAPAAPENVDEAAAAPAATQDPPAAESTDAAPDAAAAAEPAPKPKRSRWGGKVEGDADSGEAKRSRWGGKEDGGTPTDGDGTARKRSRWGSKPKEPTDPLLIAVQLGIPLATLQHMAPAQQEMLPGVKARVDEIDLLLRLDDCGVSEIPPERRSPSPEPIFDRTGTCVNSRPLRRRKQLEEDRLKVIDSLKPKVAQRQWRKLMVPIDKYPGYNFFGALIGPRGNAQKRMERESGCKIVIRGKGAIKDGCSRHDGKPLGPEDEEPMHVLIEGPDEETVELGQRIVEVVLNPYSEDAVQAKEKQMRELAIINGTPNEDGPRPPTPTPTLTSPTPTPTPTPTSTPRPEANPSPSPSPQPQPQPSASPLPSA